MTEALRRGAIAGIVVAAAALLPCAGGAQQAAPAASVPAAGTVPSSGDDPRRTTQQDLEQIQSEIRLSEGRTATLRAEIDRLDKDRARIAEQLLQASQRARKLETDANASEARIVALDADVARQRASLYERRGLLAEILASLQRMGRNPPPAVMVRPNDALGAVRSALLMGAILPELRDQAQALADDLRTMQEARDRAARERDEYRGELTALAEERARLEILGEERRRGKGDQQRLLDEERRRAQDLAARATNLKDLISRSETDIESARKAAVAAANAAAEEARKAADAVRAQGDAARPAGGEVAGSPKGDEKTGPRVASLDPGRMQPSVPFQDARGRMNVPAIGAVLKGFGDDDGTGTPLKGQQIATRSGANVTSPADGWVVYAGTFRSYGKLLIINGGGGYHVVLAGMDRVDVEIGQFVLAGEPVGAMGERRSAGVIADVKAGQPVLYIEFRKDGTPIDPAPWWGQPRDEKVRG